VQLVETFTPWLTIVVFVHPENLLELKTYLLRHLPVLVYNPSTSKIADGTQKDPTITSLYFDNPKFTLYTRKVDKAAGASSLRLRWYGHLSEKPEITLEKKTLSESDDSEEIRFNIKDKYIIPFIKGEYKMEKSINKLKEKKGEDAQEVKELESNVKDIQSFVLENELQPMLRLNFSRTAFQIPGEDRVRVSIDTNLTMIREDALDKDRPCRDPENWHREDIDEAGMQFPFSKINKGEISKFPYAVLEIKIKDGGRKKKVEWVDDLMSSHLVKDVPRYSKFVHGVAQLFEDHINTFPFWLSYLETDIRRDPKKAFEEEQEKKARQADDEIAVGSFIGSKSGPIFKPAVGSPAGKDYASPSGKQSKISKPDSTTPAQPGEDDGDAGGIETENMDSNLNQTNTAAGLRSLFPSFSTSKYAQAQRSKQRGITIERPGYFLKDVGEVKVEPKVWLANQRTFIKWEHISILLGSLGLSLYNSAGASSKIAEALAIIYTAIALFAGAWGYYMYMVRSTMIRERSGRDFDNVIGPVIVCASLIAALCINFALKVCTTRIVPVIILLTSPVSKSPP
jgi:uncharacterized membrane protein YidH (DUF202 family)